MTNMKTGNIVIIESESRFKKVDKSLIENPNIDCLTLGIYTKLIVLGKKWNLNINGLREHLGLSDAKVRKSLSLLEKEGYILRTPARNSKGQMEGWNYTIYPTPITKDERSKAGFKNFGNRPQQPPTTPKTDHTAIGGDLNNKLNKQLDLKELKTEDNNKKFNFLQALIDLGITEQVAKDWLLVRKEKKATNTQTAFERIAKEIRQCAITPNECISIAVERSWIGFKAEWLDNIFNKKTTNNTISTPKQVTDNSKMLRIRVVRNDGKVLYLEDGTVFKNNHRYYTARNGKEYSIPVDEMARPDDRYQYRNSEGWYLPFDLEQSDDLLWD